MIKAIRIAYDVPALTGNRGPRGLYRRLGREVKRYTLGFVVDPQAEQRAAATLAHDLTDFLQHSDWANVVADVVLELAGRRSFLYLISFGFFKPKQQDYSQWRQADEGVWARQIKPVSLAARVLDRFGKHSGLFLIKTGSREFLKATLATWDWSNTGGVILAVPHDGEPEGESLDRIAYEKLLRDEDFTRHLVIGHSEMDGYAVAFLSRELPPEQFHDAVAKVLVSYDLPLVTVGFGEQDRSREV